MITFHLSYKSVFLMILCIVNLFCCYHDYWALTVCLETNILIRCISAIKRVLLTQNPSARKMMQLKIV